jgi:hypothetical protein
MVGKAIPRECQRPALGQLDLHEGRLEDVFGESAECDDETRPDAAAKRAWTRLGRLPSRTFSINAHGSPPPWSRSTCSRSPLPCCCTTPAGACRTQDAALRLLHVAARLARGQRRLRLRINRAWPWATHLTTAFGTAGLVQLRDAATAYPVGSSRCRNQARVGTPSPATRSRATYPCLPAGSPARPESCRSLVADFDTGRSLQVTKARTSPVAWLRMLGTGAGKSSCGPVPASKFGSAVARRRGASTSWLGHRGGRNLHGSRSNTAIKAGRSRGDSDV